jgi:hypothetical protein
MSGIDWKLLVGVRERQKTVAMGIVARDRAAADQSRNELQQAEGWAAAAGAEQGAALAVDRRCAVAGGSAASRNCGMRAPGAVRSTRRSPRPPARGSQAGQAHAQREQTLDASRRKLRAASGDVEKAQQMQQRARAEELRVQEQRLDETPRNRIASLGRAAPGLEKKAQAQTHCHGFLHRTGQHRAVLLVGGAHAAAAVRDLRGRSLSLGRHDHRHRAQRPLAAAGALHVAGGRRHADRFHRHLGAHCRQGGFHRASAGPGLRHLHLGGAERGRPDRLSDRLQQRIVLRSGGRPRERPHGRIPRLDGDHAVRLGWRAAGHAGRDRRLLPALARGLVLSEPGPGDRAVRDTAGRHAVPVDREARLAGGLSCCCWSSWAWASSAAWRRS